MKEQNVIDLSKIIEVVRRRAKVIIVIMIISVLIGSYFSFFKSYPSVYAGKASILIGNIPGNQNGEDRYYEMLVNQNILNTYTQIAKSTQVAEAATSKLGKNIKPEDLINSITITPIEKTMVMEIKFTGGEAKEVSDSLNAYLEALVETSHNLYPAMEIKVFNKPNIAEYSGSFSHKLAIVNALIIGFVLSIITAFLLERGKLSDTK